MKASSVESWIWVLIYGGLFAVVFGFALRNRTATLATVMMTGGVLIAAVGVLLVWVRSRMRDEGDR